MCRVIGVPCRGRRCRPLEGRDDTGREVDREGVVAGEAIEEQGSGQRRDVIV